jgi:hypothetical protein
MKISPLRLFLLLDNRYGLKSGRPLNQSENLLTKMIHKEISKKERR